MTVPYKYKYEPWSKVCTSDDWSVAALDFLGGRCGLTGEFKYSTLGINIFNGTKVSGMKTVDYANKYLFETIGVTKHSNYLAETAEDHKHFIMDKEPKGDIWFCDSQGVGTSGYGLCFSAEDLAKIGQLCLNKGKYNGKQIVSAGWIKDKLAPLYNCGQDFRGMAYGYLWWIIDNDRYAAIGNSGNVIYVNKQKNM